MAVEDSSRDMDHLSLCPSRSTRERRQICIVLPRFRNGIERPENLARRTPHDLLRTAAPRRGDKSESGCDSHAQHRSSRYGPGAMHHLAFKVESRAEVDRLHVELLKIGAAIVIPPREFPEYTPPGYYALFFKDPDGIRYEIVTH